MHLKLLSITTLIITTLLISGCGDKEKKEEEQYIEVETPQQPTTFILQDNNQTITATLALKGLTFHTKEPLVLLNFFATWCPPCRAEIPHLVNLQKKYRDKLKIVAILVEEKGSDQLQEFIQTHEINYFVSNSKDNMALAKTTADMLHQPPNFSIPMMVLFINGKYFRHYIGMIPEEMLESDIKEALKEVQ
jgi:thiol-disulfide isomerase/thioredoxin